MLDSGPSKFEMVQRSNLVYICSFLYLGFYVAFNTVQVISRLIVGRAEETSTYSLLGLCIVTCRPAASNYQFSHLRPSQGSNPGLRGGRRECYHSATVAPNLLYRVVVCSNSKHFNPSSSIILQLFFSDQQLITNQ